MLPRSGDVLHITRAASVQFVRPILFRVIRVQDWVTYDGWVWLDGYELNSVGDAVERRDIFVQLAGLHTVSKVPDLRARNGRRPRLTGATEKTSADPEGAVLTARPRSAAR